MTSQMPDKFHQTVDVAVAVVVAHVVVHSFFRILWNSLFAADTMSATCFDKNLEYGNESNVR